MLSLHVESDTTPPIPRGRREVNAWRDEAGRVCCRLFTHGQHRWIDWPGLGVFGFEAGAVSVRVWPALGAPSEVIADTFRRVLQPAILQSLGWQALHASAVESAAGVLTFCGSRHSGKSTIAYALREAGFRQLADDALVMQLDGGRVLAHALPFSARLRPNSRGHFSSGSDPTPGVPRTEQPASVASVAAFFVLQQDPRASERVQVVQSFGARAFAQLLTHAHCFDQTDSAETRRVVEDYLEIIRRVPVFELTYYPSLALLPEVIAAILRAMSDGSGDGSCRP